MGTDRFKYKDITKPEFKRFVYGNKRKNIGVNQRLNSCKVSYVCISKL